MANNIIMPNDITELCKLAFKYGSDKCPQIKHTYTPYYFDLLKERRLTIKKVLEVGVGEGASLRMWRDFFPNAKVYGADIESGLLIKEDRIESFRCDQSSKDDLLELIKKTGSDIDLVIDDGSHIPEHQVFTCLTLMPRLKKNVIYVIEDVADPSIKEHLGNYDYQIPELEYIRSRHRWKFDISKSNRLIIVRHKNG